MRTSRFIGTTVGNMLGFIIIACVLSIMYPLPNPAPSNPSLDSMKVQIANMSRGDLFIMQNGHIYCVYRNDGKTAFLNTDGRIIGTDMEDMEFTLFDHLVGGVQDVVPMSDPRYCTIIRKFVLQK